MKRNVILVISLAIVSILIGYLLSSISLVGRAGINFVYTEYSFLKSWWKGAALVFVVWMILFMLQKTLLSKVSKTTSNLVQAIAILIAVASLFFSYSDFRNSLSHRWLGESFHLGVYLFWLGWIVISVFLLLRKNETADNLVNHESFN